ncbi:putative oxidoreductase [Marinobacterium lacunae]|uniref:Putative oxidoreductase n=1 Tax=Marinobacterium lacunae TaxID=1232683 RepID=A0A081FYZ9_9GAMM|nr:Gfo/Idh/MocA family oxidoreductase [Marinobacterium lacunae]KEA63754.1 putative oxidoreductase [Marinobacterium lacunae]
MNSYRIAVMGAGVIGQQHVKLLNQHPQTTLAALVDISEAGKAYAKEQSVPFYRDRVEMLDREKPDAVIIALPNQLHVVAAQECISRGIPVLLEKPVADTLEAACCLVDIVEQSDIPVLVGHHRRHSPDIQAAKRAIVAGKLGSLVAANGFCFVKKHDAYFEAQWRRKAGGGPVLINLIHDIDCFRYLCGEIVQVQAVTSNRARELEVEDTAAVTLKFANGALGTLVISDAVPSPYCWDVVSGQALYLGKHRGDCYYIGGTEGTLAVPSLALWRQQPGEDWRHPLVQHQLQMELSNCYVNQLQHFLCCIDGSASPLVSVREGLQTLAATLAVSEAASRQSSVNIAELIA